MRTLAVAHLAELSGPGLHMYPRLQALAQRGVLETVLPGEGPARAQYAAIGETTVLPYRALTVPADGGEMLRLGPEIAHMVRVLRRHLVRTRPDLVVVLTSVLPQALLAARLAGVPAIVYVAEMFDRAYVPGRGRRLASAALARLTLTMADRVVAPSHTVAGQFAGMRGAGKVAVVYSRVNLAPGADRGAARRTFGLGIEAKVVVSIGNITRGRGQDLLLRSLPRLRETFPDTRCLIVGQPHERERDREYMCRLRDLVTELGLSDVVVFAGFVHPVEPVYAAADVIVNPARVAEAFSNVGLEAQAAGCPLVIARVGAVPELFRDGVDALVVEPESPAAIARAIERVWTDPELCGRLVGNGHARARGLDEASGVEEFMRIVDDLVAAGPAS